MASIPLVALVVLVVVVGFAIVAKRKHESFNERYPPISDEEFLALCTPGVNPKVALKVRQIVAESLGIERERIYPSFRFNEDLD
jgi:hypothetical protein